MFMSNFTRSGSRAKKWQAISNLSCCGIEQITKQFKSMKAIAFMVLFMLGSSTMFASEFIPGCMSDAPSGPTADMYALSVECEGPVEVVKTTEMIGDDCNWEVIHSYQIKCNGQDLPTAKIHFIGGDTILPTLEGTIPSGEDEINLCYDEIPAGPDEATIALLFADNCSEVIVEKSGEPEGTDCEWTVKYSYTVRDLCGNYYPDPIEITYNGGDTGAPTLVKGASIPTGENGMNACFEFKEQGPTEDEILALFEDNCGAVTVIKTESSKGSDCKWMAVYTYTIQDECGNFADPISIVYRGGDFEAPELVGVPDDVTVNCIDEIPEPPTVTATDNCAFGNKISFTEDTSGLGIACEGGVLIRTWTTFDDCGRSDSQDQIITVLPAPAATWDETPVNKEITCTEADGYQAELLSYSNGVQEGACAINGSAEGVITGTFSECGGNLQVTWSFEDECERSITYVQDIVVLPAPAATWVNPPQDMQISCEQANSYQAPSLGYSNNLDGVCGIYGEVAGELSGSYTECGGTLYVDWYFKDECDREIFYTKTIIVEPAPKAEFDPIEDMTISCEEANVFQAGYLGYTNNGTGVCLIAGEVLGELTGSYTECGGTLVVDWYFKDECERESFAQKVITVLPAPQAEFDPIEDMTITCEEANVFQAGYLGYTNNGTGLCLITGEVLGELSGSYTECGGTLYVDWYFKDECLRESFSQKVITVLPAPKAEFDPIEDMTISCEEANVFQAGNLGYTNNGTGACLIAGEVLGELTGSYTECGGTLVVDWYFKDECERESFAQKVITVLPAPQAEFDLVSAISISCEEANNYQAGYLAYTNNGTGACLIAGEALGELSGSYTECGGLLFVDWYFKDDCDRESFAQLQIKVEPAPQAEFDPIEDMTITCEEANVYQAGYLGYTNNGTGPCLISGEVLGELTGSYTECGGTLYVDWYFKDECDRESFAQKVITVLPAPKAEFNPIEDMTITCEEANIFQAGYLGYTNNGTGPCLIAGEVLGELSGSYTECGGTLVVDWYFIDDCDRESFAQKVITVLPAPQAEFDPIEDMTITCEEANVFQAGYLGYTNNGTGACLIAGEVLGELSGSYTECGGTLYVDWYFKDECLRESFAQKVITVLPAPKAEFDPIEDMTITCEEANIFQAGYLGYTNNGTGACLISGEVLGELTGSYTECGGTLVVDWYFKDECERESFAQKIITVLPAPQAEFAPVEDMTITCEEANVYQAGYLGYTNNGTEACLIAGEVLGELTGSYTECGGTLYVDWYFKDECLRESFAQKVITVLPAPQAEFDPIEDMTITCEEANIFQAGYLAYTNNGTGACLIAGEALGELSGSYTECGGTLYVDWYFKDECLRESFAQKVITVLPAPQANFDPIEDMTITCEEANVFQAGYLGYTNNGTGLCLIAGEVLGELSGSYTECGGTLYVDWYFKDECLRESFAQKVITVLPAPKAEFDPIEDASIFCEDLAAYVPEFLSYSNGNTGVCDISGSVQGIADPFEGSCGEFEVNFSFTDDCGHTITAKQIITVVDETAPTLDGVIPPGESNLNLCYEDRPNEESHPFLTDAAIAALYSDNCGNVNVSHTVVELGDDCDWAIMFRYEIQDDCGNFANPVKVFFNGGDNDAPELTGDLPEGVSGLQCLGENPDAPDPLLIKDAYTDNCSGVTVTPLEPVIEGDDCGWTATYEYIIEDACGNKADNVIIINSGADTLPPTLDGIVPLGENTLDLCIDSPLGEPTEAEIALLYIDNCTNPITAANVSKIEKVYGTDCEWIRVFEYVVSDDCGNPADLIKVNYQGGDVSEPVPTGACDEEAFLIEGCPESATVSLEIGNEVSVNDLDWTVAGIPIGQLGNGTGLINCFTDNCADVGELTFRVTDKTSIKDACSNIITLTFEVEDNCENIYPGFICTFIIVDTTAPVITCPADIDFGNNPELGPDGYPVGIATKADYTDNCQPDGETEDYTDVFTPGAGGGTVGFVGDFAEGNWTINLEGGSIVITAADMTIIGNSDFGGTTQATATCPVSGTYSFDWDYANPEDSAFWDPAFYVNGVAINLTSGGNESFDSGSLTVNCAAGDVIGFGINSLDGLGSGATLVISNFTVGGGEGPSTLVRTFTANDGCDNTASCDVTYTWTEDEDPISCGYPIVNCGDVATGDTSDGGIEDVEDGLGRLGNWYSFIGTGENVVTFSTCNDADFDTVIHVFTDCGTNEIAVNDDAAGCGLTSELGFFAELGVEYNIFIRGFVGATGNYGLSVICDTEPGQARTAEVQDDVKIDFTAYPVPFDKEVNISYTFEFDTDVTIEMFDTKGLLIYSQTNRSYSKGSRDVTKFDLSRTANQMFYVKLTTSQGTVTKKIVSSSPNRH